MPLTPADRTRIARQAALRRSAKESGASISAPVRQAFYDSFLPGGKRGGPAEAGLSADETERRRVAAMRAYFVELRAHQIAKRRGEL